MPETEIFRTGTEVTRKGSDGTRRGVVTDELRKSGPNKHLLGVQWIGGPHPEWL